MRLQGSKMAFILCNECQGESPSFRIYLYEDEDGKQWQGESPEGWMTDEEAELEETGAIVGWCPKHYISGG